MLPSLYSLLSIKIKKLSAPACPHNSFSPIVSSMDLPIKVSKRSPSALPKSSFTSLNLEMLAKTTRYLLPTLDCITSATLLVKKFMLYRPVNASLSIKLISAAVFNNLIVLAILLLIIAGLNGFTIISCAPS